MFVCIVMRERKRVDWMDEEVNYVYKIIILEKVKVES